MPSVQETRAAVITAIQVVASHSGRVIEHVADDDSMSATLGFDSLDLAQVVVSLEQRFGVDPFRTPGKPLRTVGDLISAFAAAGSEKK